MAAAARHHSPISPIAVRGVVPLPGPGSSTVADAPPQGISEAPNALRERAEYGNMR
jgi:hypothetical protein